RARALNQRQQAFGRYAKTVEGGSQRPAAEMTGGEALVGGESCLFERMGERVVADVMKQRGELDVQLLGYTAGKVVCPQRVLKPGVRGAGVHEKCVTELPDVPQALVIIDTPVFQSGSR